MKKLRTAVFEAFWKEYFTVKKTSHVFSAIETDQAQKKNNKVIETDGGAIGIFDNERALLGWALPGPHISDMIFESINSNSTTHHKDSDLFEKQFRLKHSLLVEAFQKVDILITDSPSELINIASMRLLLQRKLVLCLYKKNNLALHRSKNMVSASKTKYRHLH